MKVTAILLSAFLMLSLTSPVVSQENNPELDIEGLSEALEALEEEGNETVPVPIPLMRNALWYYEAYFMQEDIIDEYKDELDYFEDALSTCNSRNEVLEKRNNTQGNLLIFAGSYGAVVTITTVVLLILK